MRKLSITTLFLGIALSCISAKPEAHKNRVDCKLSEADQRKFYTYFYDGIRLKDSGSYDDALQSFRMCLSIDSLNGGALSEAGMLYTMSGSPDLAIRCMEKAVDADPANWWYNVQLISLYSGEKKWTSAIKAATNLQKKYPNREEVYSMLSSLYKQNKDFKHAIAALDMLENIGGIDQAVSLEKFQLYLLLNKPKKGIAEVDKLVNKFPSDSRYKVLRGDIYMQQHMPDQAYAIYCQVLKDDPTNALVYVSLSEYYNEKNQPDKALDAIVSALKTEELDVDTKVQVLGQYVEKLVRDSTKFAETESLFKMLIDRYPLEEQVHGYYAVFLQYQNRKQELISELETMLNINSKNERTWLQLIQINLGDKELDKVLDLTKHASENLPAQSAFYFYRGIAFFQQNEMAKALDAYRTGLPLVNAQQGALKSDFYAQIGDCYFKLEKRDSAFVNYDRSLEANPKNIMVMNNYAYYLSLEKKDLKKAERMSAKTVELEPKNSTYLDTYAWILYQQGVYSLAKVYIEMALDNLQKDEDHGVILEHYGDILWMNKDDVKALEVWQKSYDAGNKTDDLKKKIDRKGMPRPEEK